MKYELNINQIYIEYFAVLMAEISMKKILKMYIISEMLKSARKEAKMTQKKLAKKTGTKKAIFRN